MAAGSTSKGNAVGPTERFFAELAERGREPLLQRVSGTIRFDIGAGKKTEHWYVKVKKGAVDISHKNGPADAVVRADRSLLDDITAGRANAMAAVLRGVLVPEGDLGLVMTFQRLFPGPPKKGPAKRPSGRKRQ